MEIPWQMWEHRNEILHGEDHIWKTLLEEEACRKIQQIFNDHVPQNHLAADLHFFDETAEHMISHCSVKKCNQWILSIKQARSRFH